MYVGLDHTKIEGLNFIFASIQSVAFFMCLSFIRERPVYAPSLSATQEKLGIMDSMKIVFSDMEYVLDCIALSMGLGVGWTLISVVAILLEPFGYSQG